MAPFCPWLDYQYVLMDKDSKLTLQDFYDYSLAWLEVSDAMLVIGDWQSSKGTLKEIEFAQNKIPIFYDIKDLLQWKTKLDAAGQ